jgi:hypothetical protein
VKAQDRAKINKDRVVQRSKGIGASREAMRPQKLVFMKGVLDLPLDVLRDGLKEVVAKPIIGTQ